jgi:hypothetical protein
VRQNLKNLDAIILPVIVPQKNLFVNFSTLEAEKEYLPIAQSILNNLVLARKKIQLQDLNDFLKQQAATLVTPENAY